MKRLRNNIGYDYVITVPRKIIPASAKGHLREIHDLLCGGPAAPAKAVVDSRGMQGEAGEEKGLLVLQ